MKQKWMVFLLSILAAMPAAAASITVKTPVANENIEIGAINPVSWTYAGLGNATKIMIVLWRNGSKLGIIAQNLGIGSSGQGSYDWSAGAYTGGPAAAGSGYSIKVRTMDNSVSGFSGSFTLSDKPGNPGTPLQKMHRPSETFPDIEQVGFHCMVITAPKKGDTADPNNIVSIKWNRNGLLDLNVAITLLRKGRGVIPGGVKLAASAPNNGLFNWDPKPLAPAPGIYMIKVRTLDGKCEAISDEFTILEIGGITLLSPSGGETWENGTAHEVTWKRLGNIQSVDIILYRGPSIFKTLAQGVDAKLGTKTSTFVRGDTDGANPICYKIGINHSGGNTTNPSGCITMTGNPDLAVSASFSPGMANVGTNLTFTIKVENKGVVRSQVCQGDFYVNGVIDQAFPVPAIDPGTTATITRIWKLACPGTVKIIIDPGQVNVEPDKANNVWEKKLCN